jgi:orotidine-5'-phosphate decarboxylase
MTVTSSFGDRLPTAVAARESQVVLGLDPDPARLWPSADRRAPEAQALLGDALQAAVAAGDAVRAGASGAATRADAAPAAGAPHAAASAAHGNAHPAEASDPPHAAARVLAHCLEVVDAAGPACVAVKPQLACFERLGAGGWLAYEVLAAHVRAAGLLLIADGKRGDVPVSATAYGHAFFTDAAVAADALTVNPLLGADALAPLIDAASAAGAGVFVLVRTSNPGAAELMDARLESGEPLWERIAAMVDALGAPSRVPSGFSAVGAVTGATVPAHLRRMRELMPATPFLLPGIGAQGGRVEDVAPAFAPGRAGGLVTASRSIVYAHESGASDPATAARAEAERLRATAWELA